MDVLTDIVRLLRPRTVLLGALLGLGRWGVAMPPQPGPAFFLILQGQCWFQAECGVLLELRQGDYLLSSRPGRSVFVSDPSVTPQLTDEAFKARHTIHGEIVLAGDGDAPACRIQGGVVLCEPANADLLIGLMPALIHVRAVAGAGARLNALATILADEAAGDRSGREAMLSRLIELMLIETLRSQAVDLAPRAGVLRALADPRLSKALAAIHSDVARGWTVAELARLAGMSRSVFARRFTDAVGLAPVEYLLDWRMALAKDALAHGRGTMDEVAVGVGYRSASAFSTAFRRRIGRPPGAYAASVAAARAQA